MSKLFSRNALAALALAFPAAVLGQPTVTALVNNYSNIPPGVPSYGIAPGSLFIIYGTDLSDNVTPVLQNLSTPLPLTLNHTSIAVTVGGKVTNPAMYYTSPTQVAAVLPSSTPVGTGTITVTYNGTASAAAPIVVTASAFGADTLPGSTGVTATDANYHLITPTASASPGQTIVVWGSGLGADTKNDDRTYPLQQDNLNDATVYIGGVKASVAYAGRSQYPGVDQINVVVPALGAAPALEAASEPAPHATSSGGFQGGCGTSFIVVAHGVVSRSVTLPVQQGNGVCSDPALGITGNETQPSPNRKTGFIQLTLETLPSSDLSDFKPQAQAFTTRSATEASFSSITGGTAGPVSFISIGNCYLVLPGAPIGNPGTSTGLDAGTPIALSGGGLAVQLPETAQAPGSYFAELTSPLTGGTTYTFTGPGGKDVGSFKVSVTFPQLLDWTNQNSISTVTESQGQSVTWTGGEPGTYVVVGGSSSTNPPLGDVPQTVSFICFVPVADDQFTVPSYVLQALPTGKGTLALTNSGTPVPFSPSGVSAAVAMAGDTIDINVTYQ